MGDDVWSELATGKEIGSLRRNLQRAHLDQLITSATRTPGGTPRAAPHAARPRGEGAPHREGRIRRPHLQESLMRIDRALNATSVLQ